MLDDDPLADIHNGAAPNDEKPTFEVADPANPSGPSPTLSGGFAEPGTDDGKNTLDNPAMYNMDNHAGGGEEGGHKPHEDEALRTRTLAGGNGGNECSGSGIGSNAPSPSPKDGRVLNL